MTKNHSARKGANIQGTRKRRQLLEAAGRAFAEKGYAGTTIRDIAEIANVQPSALIYHFDNKENLFRATLKFHIMENANLAKIADALDEIDYSNPEQSFSNVFFDLTKRIIGAFHGPRGKIPHLAGLIMSMLVDGNKLTTKMVQELGVNSMKKLSDTLMRIKPDITPTNLFWWRHLYWSLIFYTLFGEQILLARMNEKKYPREFLDTVAYRIAKTCCNHLGLPTPGGDNNNWQLEINADSVERLQQVDEK